MDYGQYGQGQQQDAYKQALLSQLKSGAPPPAGAAYLPNQGTNTPPPNIEQRPDGLYVNGQVVPDTGPGGIAGGSIEKQYQQLPTDPGTNPGSTNANLGYIPSGWDATKWNDPNKHDLKYDLGHLLASVSNNGAISPDDVKKVAPQIAAMGVKWDGGDGLTLPDGNRVDFIRGMKTGNGQLNWLDSTMGGGPGHVAPTGGAPTAPPAPIIDPSMNINGPATTPDQNSLWQQIMAQLNDPNNAHLMQQLQSALGNNQGVVHAMTSAAPAAQMLASRLQG